MSSARSPGTAVRTAASATFVIFGLNGLVFASWAARIPSVAATLSLSDAQMGALLLIGAIGSVLALPLAGLVVGRVGTAHTVRIGAILCGAGAVLISTALLTLSVPGTAIGLFVFGSGVALWDVAQNIEGADVERRMRRTIMPQFHAAFSGGAFVGALVGAGLALLSVELPAHLLGAAVVTVVAAVLLPKYFLPVAHPHAQGGPSSGRRFAAWAEPRTLVIGLVVLGAALTEGAANDWIAKATVDGLNTGEAVGSLMFAMFVGAMTTVRFIGGRLIDRFGRVMVLRASLGSALVGLLVFVVSPVTWLAAAGAVLWGAGAALGFPVGMSAAADDPTHAAARVSVVSTVGYTAFLAGPPLLGFLGEAVGIRNALLAVGVAVLASLLTVSAARERSTDDVGR